MFFRKKDKLVDNSLITNYLNLLMELTSIESSKESLDKDIKKEKSGKLLNKYNCKMFSHIKKQYAIRFNDDMNVSEFEDVFTLLIKKFGNPSEFSEYHGYVWNFEEYTLTFGYVSAWGNSSFEVYSSRESDMFAMIRVSIENGDNLSNGDKVKVLLGHDDGSLAEALKISIENKIKFRDV